MRLALLLAPLAVAAVLALLTSALHRRLPPRVAARAIAASLVAVCAAAVPSLWLISLSFLAHLPLVGDGFRWCAMAIGIHDEIPWMIGAPSLVVAAFGTPRALKVLRLDRRLRIHTEGPIEYIDDAEPYAVTLPGRGGRIVISTGLLDVVDDDELGAVIAHEETHARYRHDRYLLAARTVSAAVPLLRPITARLQYALERWADESAAQRCRDRRIVASALAKVALAQPPMPAVLSFAGLGVTARVQALIAPAPQPPNRVTAAILWAAIAVTSLLGAVQLHHLGRLFAALCPG